MLEGFFFLSLIGAVVELFKESCEPTIPKENWANTDLYDEDIVNGVPVEQRLKNLENGKYKAKKTYPQPHRDITTNKIVIENDSLYKNDVKNYGAYQTMKWAKQGKYNLSPSELAEENKRIRAKIDYMCSL